MIAFASKARPYIGALTLTTALLCAAGIYGYTRMPSGVYPEVTFPRIAVVATVPDLDVTKMELSVTRELEEAVSTVIGVAQVRSKTIRGSSELSVVFNPGTDMLRAEQLTWNRISARRSKLPADTELTVEQMTPSVFPIMSVVLTGTEKQATAQLRDYAYYQLAPQVKHVPDVLYANVAGGDIREIEVIARPDDLVARGLSAADLADQLGQINLLMPVGRSESQPLAYQLLVNNQAVTPHQIEEIVVVTKKGLPVRVRDVADVKIGHKDRLLSIGADLKDAVVITVFRRLGGNVQTVSNGVHELLQKSGLVMPIGDARKPPPRNIQATVVYDQARFVETAVDNVRDAILVGSLFSILILLAFLRSWRATLISAIAIPVTLAITFLILRWTGQTLNLMSLGGLAVAVGLIIDDTVVVIENIARHLHGGRGAGTPNPPPQGRRTDLSPQEGSAGNPLGLKEQVGNGQLVDGAARNDAEVHVERDPVDLAAREITGAVVGSTLTTVLVFVPLAFIVGVYGQFFAALSWSLSAAVLVSMVISLTLIPVFAARFLAGRTMPAPGPIYRFFAHLYELLLAGALRFPKVTLSASLAAMAFGVLLFTGIPRVGAAREAGKPPPAPLVKGLETGLMPAMDEGAFVLDYWAPSGAPLAQTEAMAQEVEKVIAKNPDVDTYVRRTGSENGIFATKTSRGDITVVLRPLENDPLSLLWRYKSVRPPLEDVEKELKKAGLKLDTREGRDYVRKKYRRRPVAKVMEEIEDEVKENFAEHQLKFETVQIMQDELDDLSGANKPLEVKLFGAEHPALRELADKVAETIEKKGKGRGVKEVNSNVFAGNPDLMIQVDYRRADRLNVKPADIVRQFRAMFAGQVAASVPESAVRITDIRVRYPDSIRFGNGRLDPDRVLRQLVLLPEGQNAQGTALAGPARALPLSAIANLTPVRTADEQYRENQQPMTFVTAEINEEEAGLGSVVADVRRWMSELSLPGGYRWELGGHYQQQRETFQSGLLVIVVAILLVFIMLAFQFRSLALPLLIFLTQPLSLVSGLFALWITGTPFNVSSGMGAILLIGLDMKNGILLVEYVQQLRAEGMELRAALMEAGRVRFRPILMTSLAAILGLLPLALGIGPGAQMQQPLAIMVIGGLIANMLFTRVVIPVGYLVMERRPAATVALSRPPAAVTPVLTHGEST